MMSRQAGETAK